MSLDSNDSSPSVELIAELEALDLRSVEDDGVYQQVRWLMARYGARQTGLNPLNRFYRIRKNLDERIRSNQSLEWYPPLFSEVRSLWYPPAKHSMTRGRVNRPGESVFYCADSIDTAMLEMRAKVGEYLTILECAFVNDEVKPNIFEAGIHEGPGSFNPNYGDTPPDKDQQYQRYLDREGISEQTRLIREFLVKQFRKTVEPGSEHEYKITNSIAGVLLNEFGFLRKTDLALVEMEADGIAYASIASEAKGANIAFTCAAADRLLKPVACGVFIVEESENSPWGAIRRTHKAKSNTTSGDILW